MGHDGSLQCQQHSPPARNETCHKAPEVRKGLRPECSVHAHALGLLPGTTQSTEKILREARWGARPLCTALGKGCPHSPAAHSKMLFAPSPLSDSEKPVTLDQQQGRKQA